MMTTDHTPPAVLGSLARILADHAVSLGASKGARRRRSSTDHLGAIMADAILQSGLNYRTVVFPRVVAILDAYPDANSLSGVNAVIRTGRLPDFLLWNHATKLDRFRELACYFGHQQIETSCVLSDRIEDSRFRHGLLELPGIGPKTVDYLACLVGKDAIAVDRHIRSFAREAGLRIKDYDTLRLAFCYAADFLGVSRRDFDSWVWATISSRRPEARRLATRVGLQ